MTDTLRNFPREDVTVTFAFQENFGHQVMRIIATPHLPKGYLRAHLGFRPTSYWPFYLIDDKGYIVNGVSEDNLAWYRNRYSKGQD